MQFIHVNVTSSKGESPPAVGLGWRHLFIIEHKPGKDPKAFHWPNLTFGRIAAHDLRGSKDVELSPDRVSFLRKHIRAKIKQYHALGLPVDTKRIRKVLDHLDGLAQLRKANANIRVRTRGGAR